MKDTNQFLHRGCDWAGHLHGYQRFTGDIDIWLKDTLENRQALRKAFVNCNMGDYPIIEYMQFIPGWTEFYLNNGLRLDILVDMKGLEEYTFDECLNCLCMILATVC